MVGVWMVCRARQYVFACRRGAQMSGARCDAAGGGDEEEDVM